jgi:hypothetical protein
VHVRFLSRYYAARRFFLSYNASCHFFVAIMTTHSIPMLLFTLAQVICRCSGSVAAAAQLLSTSLSGMQHISPETTLQPLYVHMLAARSLASLLLFACDVTEGSHPLHIIASDAVELIASHAVQQVMTVASSSPPSLSYPLFAAAAVASRAGDSTVVHVLC